MSHDPPHTGGPQDPTNVRPATGAPRPDRVIRCAECDTAILAVRGSHVELLAASLVDVEWQDNRVRWVVRCFTCGKRRRMPCVRVDVD